MRTGSWRSSIGRPSTIFRSLRRGAPGYVKLRPDAMASVRAGAVPIAAAPFAEPPVQRILIVSDAWRPQVNGVVRTLYSVAAELARMGHTVEVIGPDRFRSVSCPTYPEIRLA